MAGPDIEELDIRQDMKAVAAAGCGEALNALLIDPVVKQGLEA
jgi:hypothetical protein